MKVFVLFMFLICFQTITYSQELRGQYQSDRDTINFKDQKVQFKVQSNGGLIIYLLGMGTYELVDEYLIIEATKYEGIRSSVKVSCYGASEIRVITGDGLPLALATVSFIRNSGKIIGGGITDSLGHISISDPKQFDKIGIASLGKDPITFSFTKNCSYTITLTDGVIIENENIVFKIVDKKELNLKMILLENNFEKKKLTSGHLKKLDKKASQNKFGVRDLWR